MSVPKYIADLIKKGENENLDFKFEISGAAKIAKTLVAFANTSGGKLLIGVKDNGKIAGIRSDEEIFMIDSAAKIFSKPQIKYSAKSWNINGKNILEITIPEGKNKPFRAKDTDHKWKAYVRVNDQNFIAHNILVRYWKEKNHKKVKINYSRKEQLLLEYINDFNEITLEQFAELAQTSLKDAENILLDFMLLNIIEINYKNSDIFFTLSPKFEKSV